MGTFLQLCAWQQRDGRAGEEAPTRVLRKLELGLRGGVWGSGCSFGQLNLEQTPLLTENMKLREVRSLIHSLSANYQQIGIKAFYFNSTQP